MALPARPEFAYEDCSSEAMSGDRKLLGRLLNVLGLKACTLVDIGARGGVDERWCLLGDRLVVIGFDPDRDECARLNASVKQGRIKFLPMALSNRSGKEMFHLCRTGGTSSFYPPNDLFLKRFPQANRFDVLETREVAIDTLDNVLAGVNVRAVDFIKIDVQGSERNVLEGSHKTISGAFGVEIEVEFSELYKGQPLFSDVDCLLRDSGYVLFGLKPYYWKRTDLPCKCTGQIVFADALYLKDPIALDQVPGNPAAALAICILYRKFDYALELARFFRDKAVYHSREYDLIRAELVKLSTPIVRWDKLRGTARVASFLEAITNGLKAANWYSADDWK